VAGLFSLVDATVRYGSVEVLRVGTLKLEAGEFVAIAGPNGAGKSTLLSLLAGLAAPSSGACLWADRPAHEWNRRDFARRVAVVRQAEPAAFPFTAEEVIYMGRMPHRAGMKETVQDHAAVDKAMAATGVEPFRGRDFRTLSGGEKQRVLLASALAQEPEVLLLDEPSAHLDLHYQLSLHKLLRDLRANGLLVVAATHDLNLAAAYADRLVVLDKGRIRADGAPGVVLDSRLIEDVFRIRAEMHYRTSGQPWMVYGE
jgi:iron complex transport system ATP-binding protein